MRKRGIVYIKLVLSGLLLIIPIGACVTSESMTPLLFLLVVVPLLFLLWIPRGKRSKRSNVNLQELPTNGRDFEYWCAGYLLQQGFKEATVTRGSGDYGADIIAIDKEGNRWVVQCKLYAKPVGNSAVQEVIGAKKHYSAGNAMVMTNSKMTKQAKELAWENAVEIIEGLGD